MNSFILVHSNNNSYTLAERVRLHDYNVINQADDKNTIWGSSLPELVSEIPVGADVEVHLQLPSLRKHARLLAPLHIDLLSIPACISYPVLDLSLFTSMKRLYVHHCKSLTKIKLCAESNLEALTVADSDSLVHIEAESFPNLKHIYVRSTAFKCFDLNKCPQLESCMLMCELVPNNGNNKYILKDMKNLNDIMLSRANAIESLHLENVAVKTNVRLTHMSNLVSVTQSNSKVAHLDLLFCKKIKHINCKGLQGLQKLRVSDCDSLESAVIPQDCDVAYNVFCSREQFMKDVAVTSY